MGKSLQKIFSKINVNSSMYCRHPERCNNIRDIRVFGNLQVCRLMDWIYSDATIYMNRKYNKYVELLNLNRITHENN